MSTPNTKAAAAGRWLVLIAGSVGAAVLCVAAMTIGGSGGVADRDAASALAANLTPVSLSVETDGWLPLETLLHARSYSYADTQQLLKAIDANWRDGYAPMLLELGRLTPRLRGPVATLIRRRAGLPGDADHHAFWRWVWSRPYDPHPAYADFKAELYRGLDPRFAAYFASGRDATIRLDEVRWGGVARDGIPPLDRPKMLAATEARYLADTDVVFGIEINGDARAYPKRILAWHEMFKDTVGGVSLCGVYCTLCGMVIPYETERGGEHHELGTSGFLYRSNKLMYDHATESMWSTTKGEPAIGPLVGRGIKLKTRPVVTTTWGEWRRRHPQTTVLSLDTGHRRDYGEGAAYRSYFATDRLMFTVPTLPDLTNATPIDNKAEVLALRFGAADTPPLAILADYLIANPVYHGKHAGRPFVVVTDATGGNRVYEAEGQSFRRGETEDSLVGNDGVSWRVADDRLVGPGGAELRRLPAHRAFWFGWRAAHPDTKLIGG